MSVTATVPNGLLAEHLLISFDAISRNGGGYFVYKAESAPEGIMALPVSIDVLFRIEELAAVNSHMLEEGDHVIIEGNERLFPMMPVTIITQ